MNRRLWIEIISWCTAIAFALSLLLAMVGAAAGAASGQTVPDAPAPAAPESQDSKGQPPTPLKDAQMNVAAEEKDYEGMITDTHCGAKHRAAIDQSASDCVRVCVHNGSAFALIVGDKTYLLDGDLDLLKKSAGQRIHVHGNLTGNRIKVASISAA